MRQELEAKERADARDDALIQYLEHKRRREIGIRDGRKANKPVEAQKLWKEIRSGRQVKHKHDSETRQSIAPQSSHSDAPFYQSFDNRQNQDRERDEHRDRAGEDDRGIDVVQDSNGKTAFAEFLGEDVLAENCDDNFSSVNGSDFNKDLDDIFGNYKEKSTTNFSTWGEGNDEDEDMFVEYDDEKFNAKDREFFGTGRELPQRNEANEKKIEQRPEDRQHKDIGNDGSFYVEHDERRSIIQKLIEARRRERELNPPTPAPIDPMQLMDEDTRKYLEDLEQQMPKTIVEKVEDEVDRSYYKQICSKIFRPENVTEPRTPTGPKSDVVLRWEKLKGDFDLSPEMLNNTDILFNRWDYDGDRYLGGEVSKDRTRHEKLLDSDDEQHNTESISRLNESPPPDPDEFRRVKEIKDHSKRGSIDESNEDYEYDEDLLVRQRDTLNEEE
mmetsp:Transcript_30810/g.75129  ORF Transcript_30810/g.75129 Transcript_30810/m.75129 type:complete len:443 (+) Transcript_30810:466-1794(+)